MLKTLARRNNLRSRYYPKNLTAARLCLGKIPHFPGKCGHAYFVPHFTNSGYSGNVVEVELHTNALGSVRLHGVVTDFADFYATGGVGPYKGQVCDALEKLWSFNTIVKKILIRGGFVEAETRLGWDTS